MEADNNIYVVYELLEGRILAITDRFETSLHRVWQYSQDAGLTFDIFDPEDGRWNTHTDGTGIYWKFRLKETGKEVFLISPAKLNSPLWGVES